MSQFGDRFPLADHDWNRATGEVREACVFKVNSQVLVQCCQEVSLADNSFDRIFATVVGLPDNLTGLHSAAGEKD